MKIFGGLYTTGGGHTHTLCTSGEKTTTQQIDNENEF